MASSSNANKAALAQLLMEQALGSAWEASWQRLRRYAASPTEFSSLIKGAYGTAGLAPAALDQAISSLRLKIQAGERLGLQLRIGDKTSLSGSTLQVASSLLSGVVDQGALQRLLSEQLGAVIQRTLNPRFSGAGNETRRFSALLTSTASSSDGLLSTVGNDTIYSGNPNDPLKERARAAVASAQAALSKRASEDRAGLLSLLNDVYGATSSNSAAFNAAANQLLDLLAKGQGLGLRYELESGKVMGATRAAFAAVGDNGVATIYINADFLANASPADLALTLHEEIGHYFDTQLNGNTDTRGDEGELFAKLFNGIALTAADRAAILADDDRTVLTIDGQQVAVEQAVSTVVINTTNTTLNKASGNLSYTVTVDGGGLGADLLVAAYDISGTTPALIGWQVINRASNLTSTSYTGTFNFADASLNTVDTTSVRLRAWQGTAGNSYGTGNDATPIITYGIGDIARGSATGFTVNSASASSGSSSAVALVSPTTGVQSSASTGVTVDTIALAVTTANISISGSSGTGGAYKIGDVVTASWNNSTAGNNNTDTVSAVTVDFSQFGGGSAVTAANNGSGIWSASYTIASGSIDATSRNVSITATDNAGNVTTTAGTTNATVDNTPLTVTDANISISSGSGTGGAYKIGDVVTATWNSAGNTDTVSAVTVDFSQFGGGSAVTATNSSGIWTASYTIASGSIDATSRNVSIKATDNAGNVTTTADTTNATVDNTPLTVTDANISISGGSGTGGAYKIGDVVTASWNSSGNTDIVSAVTVDFSQFGGGSAVTATNSSGIWTASYTIASGSIDATSRNVSVTATDNAGNATTTADTTNATVDNTPLTVTDANISISGGSGTGGAYKIGDVVTATWNSSGNTDTVSAVTVDFSQFGGGSAVTATNSSGSWTASYTIASGSIDATSRNVSVTATDNAGNVTTTADTTNATVDTVVPTVAISSDKASLKAGETAALTFTLSEASTNFTAADVNVSGGTLSNFSGSGTSYSATFTPNASSTTAGSISVNSATFSDAAGNLNSAASNTLSFSIDTVVPTIAISSDKASLKAGETAALTFTLSEASTNFTAADVNVSGGTLSNFSGSGTSYSATFTPNASSTTAGSISVNSATFSDAAGNLNSAASNTLSFSIDTAAPTVVISDNAAGTANGVVTFTFTFSEAVTGFTESDISITGGTKGTFSGSGSVYTLAVTPTPDTNSGSITVDVAAGAATDAAGNASVAPATYTQAFDTVAPTVVITDNAADTATGVVTFTFTFSEDVSGFTADDITISGGSKGTFSGSGSVYTLAVTPTANTNDGTITVDVAAGAATDAAGNASVAPATYTQAFDTKAPAGATIDAVTDNVPLNTGTITSGGVSNDAELVLNGHAEAYSTVTIRDGSTVLGTANANHQGHWSFSTGTLADGSTYAFNAFATDAAGNSGSASADYTVSIDTTAPTVSISSIGGTDSIVSGQSGDRTVVGTAEANRTVTLKSGTTVINTVTADSNGNFSYVLSNHDLQVHLGQGSGKSITAYQTDAAGNTGNSAAFSFAVDTIPPTVAITTPIAGDGFLNNSETASPLTISGTSTGAAGQTVTLNVGSITGQTATVNNDGSWSVVLSSTQLQSLAEGRVNLTANLADLAGNPASTATASFIVDRTPLAAPSITSTNTSGSRVTLVISADAGSRLNIFDNGVLLSAAANNLVNGSGRYSFTTPDLADGGHIFTVTSVDQAGNESVASSAQNLTIAPPPLPTFSFTDTGTSNSDGVTSNGVVSVGNISVGNTWQFSTNAGATWSNGSSTNAFTLLPGTYAAAAVRVRQLDASGKAGSAASNANPISVDVTAPLIAVSAAKTSLGLNGDQAETTTITFTFSEANSITSLSGDALATALNQMVTLSGGSLTPLAVNGNTLTATYTPQLDYVGTAGLTVASGRFTDLAGNINVDGSDANNSLTFTLNTLRASSAPKVAISSNLSRLHIGDTATLTFTFTQPPSDFTADDISASSGEITNLAATSDPKVWTATYTPAADIQADTTITVAQASFGVDGNSGAGTNATAASLTLVVDTQAPPAVTSVAFSADSGGSTVDLITNQPDQIVTGTVSGSLSNSVGYNDVVRVSIDAGVSWRLATVTGTDRTGFSLGDVTLRGPSEIWAVVEDEVGNVSSTFKQAYTYDPITYTGALVLADYIGNIDSAIRQASGADNAFTLSLPNKETGAIEQFQVSTDGGTSWSNTTASQSGLADGTYRYRGSVTDLAGNTATSSSWTVVVDATAPNAPSVSVTSAADDGATNEELTSGAGVLRVQAEAGSTLYLAFSSTASGSTPFTKAVTAGGATQAVVLTSAETALLRGSADPTGTYSVTINAHAVDRAGNVGSAATPVSFNYTPDPIVILGELSVVVPDGGDGTEDGLPSRFTISRTGDTSQAVTVKYLLGGNAVAGVDYTYADTNYASNGYGVATILAGQSSVNVDLPTIDNNNQDGLRQIRLSLQATPAYTLNAVSNYDVANLTDNDAPIVPELSVADVSVVEGNSGTKTVNFIFKLSQATTVPVSFAYQFRDGSASLGSDASPLVGGSSGTLTIPATASQISLAVVVSGDTTIETDEILYLDLSAASGLTFRGGGSTLTAALSIVNDDSAAQVDPTIGVSITSGGDFSGTNRNDVLIGDDGINRIDALEGDDMLTGGLSADLLFSGSGADQFIYRSMAESCLNFGVDTTDASFASGDRLVLPTRPTALTNVGVITAGSLAQAFATAQADIDPLTDGAQALAPGQAVMFTWGSSVRGRRTYLGVADANTSVNLDDFLVATPLSQNAIGSLDPQAFFL